jgi:hypothetical protein
MRSVATFFRLLQPLLLMALAVALIPLMLAVVVPMLAFAWVVGLPLMFGKSGLREHLGVTLAGYLAWGLMAPVLVLAGAVPALALAFAVILHVQAGHWPALAAWVAQTGLGMPDFALIGAAAGIVGVSSTLVFSAIDIPWRLKQIRQVLALPRSRARSAAIGLAEFEGIARALGDDTGITRTGTRTAAPLYLEDETGRILVDPGEAAVRPRSLSGASTTLNEIEEGISDGDRVYVIGNVQPREDAPPGALDSERLVIRPLRQRHADSPLARLLFMERSRPADRDAPNIFIVDRGSERNVTRRLRFVIWDYVVYIVVYLGASLWLTQAVWPWLPQSVVARVLPLT